MSLETGASGLLLASQGLSAGASVSGAISQSNALKAQGYNERAFGNANADRLDANSQDSTNRGITAANKAAMKADRVIAEQRAAGGTQNVDELTTETYGLGKADAAAISNNALREAFGLKSEASSLRYRGNAAYKANQGSAKRTLVTGGLEAARDVVQGQYLYKRGPKE